MALAYNQFIGDGSTKVFNLTFPYLSRLHVQVRVNGVPVPFTWLTDLSVELQDAAAVDAIVDIRRVTPRDELLVDFKDASTLVETDLDLSALQVFYLAQEAFDLGEASLGVTEDGSFSALGRRISLLVDPQQPQDAVTKNWAETAMSSQLAQAIQLKNETVAAKNASETAQAGSQTARAGSETARAGSETARAGAETARAGSEAARDVAISARDTAQGHRNAASGSATSAAGSAATATTKAAEAAASAEDALASQLAAFNYSQDANGRVPIGTIIHSAIPQTNNGYLLCDGAPVTTMHPDLRNAFLAAGAPFGMSGSDPLLPDEVTASRFRRAANGSVPLGTVQDDQMQGHTVASAILTGAASGGGFTTASAAQTAAPGTPPTYNIVSDGVNGTPRLGNETRPKSIAYLPYIKAFGAITIEGMADLSQLLNAIATEAEAILGTNNTKLMTPLRTKQVVDVALPAYNKWKDIFSASLDGVTGFNLPDLSSYRMLRFDGAYKPSVNAYLAYRFSQNNGVSWITSGYLWGYDGTTDTATDRGLYTAGQVSGAFTFTTVPGWESSFNFRITEFNRVSAKFSTGSVAYVNTAGGNALYTVSARMGVTNAPAYNALQVYTSAGVITRGFINVEGISG